MTISLTVQSPQSPQPHCIRFDQPRVTLGRGPRCDIRLPLQVISTHHLTIEWEQGRCTVTDVGSTNGTFLRGQRLPVGQPVQLPPGASLRVVDVQLTFEFGEAAPESFTLAESGTMVRQMVRDALHSQQGQEDLAFLEILRGPQAGRRVAIPDALDDATIGSGGDALLQLPDPNIPALALSLRRQGDGFAVSPVDGFTAMRNGSPITQPLTLGSRDRLTLGGFELIFFDPLQDYLSALDDQPGRTAPGPQTHELPTPGAAETPAPSAPAATPAPSPVSAPPADAPSPESPDKKAARRGMSRAELLVLITSVLLVLLGGGLLVYVITAG
jgi:predicted component of type VI protein secretion system